MASTANVSLNNSPSAEAILPGQFASNKEIPDKSEEYSVPGSSVVPSDQKNVRAATLPLESRSCSPANHSTTMATRSYQSWQARFLTERESSLCSRRTKLPSTSDGEFDGFCHIWCFLLDFYLCCNTIVSLCLVQSIRRQCVG